MRAPRRHARALPRLRVAQLWEAPVIRNHYEAAWFRVAGRICPQAVPGLLGEDAADGMFAMEYLDPGAYPVWKHLLRDGHADPASAASVVPVKPPPRGLTTTWSSAQSWSRLMLRDTCGWSRRTMTT